MGLFTSNCPNPECFEKINWFLKAPRNYVCKCGRPVSQQEIEDSWQKNYEDHIKKNHPTTKLVPGPIPLPEPRTYFVNDDFMWVVTKDPSRLKSTERAALEDVRDPAFLNDPDSNSATLMVKAKDYRSLQERYTWLWENLTEKKIHAMEHQNMVVFYHDNLREKADKLANIVANSTSLFDKVKGMASAVRTVRSTFPASDMNWILLTEVLDELESITK